MRSADQLQVVDGHKVGGHVLAEQPASTAWTLRPTVDVLRIGPDEIAEGALVWNLLVSVNVADLIERPDLGTEAAVHAENVLVDDLENQHRDIVFSGV